jgi:hypothetical protein
MRVGCLFFVAALAMLSGCSGCREEPTIVIKFEPQDLSGASPQVAAKGTTAAAAVVDAGVAPTAKAATPSPTAAELGPCKTDADCVAVPAECCDCNAGGTRVAVLKKAAKARAAKCGETMCPQMMSTDPSCAQVAACVKGACALVAAPASSPSKKGK